MNFNVIRTAAALTFFTAGIACAQQQSAAPAPQLQSNAQRASAAIPVETFAQQPLPVTVQSGTLHTLGLNSELNIMFNAAKSKVKSAELFLLVFRDGNALGGENWIETDLKGKLRLQTKLGLKPGDRALLVVRKVQTQNETIALAVDDFNRSVRAFIQGQDVSPQQIQHIAAIIN